MVRCTASPHVGLWTEVHGEVHVTDETDFIVSTPVGEGYLPLTSLEVPALLEHASVVV